MTRSDAPARETRRLDAFRGVFFLLCLLSLAGCDSGDLKDVRARLVVEPAAVDFGEQPVLATVSRDVLLRNVGRAPVAFLEAIRIEGDAVFALDTAVDRLGGGAETTVRVTFTPEEEKTYSARLVLDTDQPDEPRLEIALSGTGFTAAKAKVEPEALDFGRVGETRSAIRRVQITSEGTAPLEIRGIGFKAGTSSAYAFVGSTRTPQVLRPREAGKDDAFVELTLKFAPAAATQSTGGVLVLETNDPGRVFLEIPLTAAINRQPVAVPGYDLIVAPGDVVALDGSTSYDPDGDDPLAFVWTLAEQPEGSAATLSGSDGPAPSLLPDRPGAYEIDLVVVDAAGLSSRAERVTVIAAPPDKLLIELLWDHPTADLDVHLRPEGTAFDGLSDCTWFNPSPDWGAPGDPSDDPMHMGDKLSGFGPERVVYEAPADGRYVAAVKYVSAQGSSRLEVTATLRVFVFGVVARELTRAFTAPGQTWDAAVIAWPGGQTSAAGGP